MLNHNYIFIFPDEMQSNVNESAKESCDKNDTTVESEDENDGTQPYILGMHLNVLLLGRLLLYRMARIDVQKKILVPHIPGHPV